MHRGDHAHMGLPTFDKSRFLAIEKSQRIDSLIFWSPSSYILTRKCLRWLWTVWLPLFSRNGPLGLQNIHHPPFYQKKKRRNSWSKKTSQRMVGLTLRIAFLLYYTYFCSFNIAMIHHPCTWLHSFVSIPYLYKKNIWSHWYMCYA